MNTFDIIIPVSKRDRDFVPKVVDLLERCFPQADNIYILTAESNIKKLDKKLRQFQKCSIIEENSLTPELSMSKVKHFFECHPFKNVRVGWYFQQFLKLGFSRSRYCRRFYLSWDADTLPLAKIEYFDGEHILFNPKYEFNPNYFRTTEKLFGIGKVFNYSFISENMMFSSEIMREMINTIENSSVEGKDWIEKILNACNFDDIMPAFSEFETYGSYCYIKHPNLYKIRFLNCFRNAGFICGRRIDEQRLRVMSTGLDLASFEWGDEPNFPLNWPHIIRSINSWAYRITHNSPKKSLDMIRDKLSGKKDATIALIQETAYRLPTRK